MSKVEQALKSAIEAMEYHTEQTRPIQKTIDTLALCKTALSEIEKCEPFGYFKAEPFGWTDCAETDEGAIALYEAPAIQREGWVSVEDRLPPLDAVSKEYNVVTKYGEVTTTTFDVFNLGTDKQFGVFNGMPVVFWQPMPAAPSETE